MIQEINEFLLLQRDLHSNAKADDFDNLRLLRRFVVDGRV
jgi:hypothetical protein